MKKRYEKRMKEVLENRLEKETFNNRLEGYNNSNYYKDNKPAAAAEHNNTPEHCNKEVQQ